jgi:alpha-beta hydrolase superfamily lysophospholipase
MMYKITTLRTVSLLSLMFLSGCMPAIHPGGTKTDQGEIRSQEFATADGIKLPLRQWQPVSQKVDAVIIALHGFNDYSRFFQQPAQYFQRHNIASYAYDLRGFGRTESRGLWAGYKTYTEDLALFTHLVAEKHPNTPIYLLGESMGGAVIVVTMAEQEMPNVAGIILAAPAIWARDFMPWYQTLLLSVLSHTMPWLTLTGESVGVVASDNIEMLRALGRDPLVIKETRVEAIHGLTDLMDAAMSHAKNLDVKTLMLYGAKDELIPVEPTSQFVSDFLRHGTEQKTVACYKKGYHMLLHDLQAPVVWQDLRNWILTQKPDLPSGAEKQNSCLTFMASSSD